MLTNQRTLVTLLAAAVILCVFLLYQNKTEKQVVYHMYQDGNVVQEGDRGPPTVHKEDNGLAIVNEEDKAPSPPEPDWLGIYSFVENDLILCQDLFPKNVSRKFKDLYADDAELSEKYATFTAEVAHQKEINRPIAGSTAGSPEETMALRRLAQAGFVKTICETGFNLGESAFMWLSSKPNVKLYSFDLGEHKYAKPMSETIKKLFPGQFTVTWGDSTITVPKFHRENPNFKCDLLFVDGGHTKELFQADLDNFIPMAEKVNIVIVDDYPAGVPAGYDDMGDIWETARRTFQVAEIIRCTYARDYVDGKYRATRHGFVAGRVLN